MRCSSGRGGRRPSALAWFSLLVTVAGGSLKIMPARFSSALLPLLLVLGGCPVWLDGRSDDTRRPPSEECVSHGDCDEGSACVAFLGECRETAPCETDDHCRASEVCDHRGTCVPRAEGECRGDAECAPSERCVTNRCKAEDSICQFDHQCGVDGEGNARVCVNNECARVCVSDGECGSGQRCASNLCVTDPNQCTHSSECGAGSHCVDGSCRPACTTALDCPGVEICDEGFCRPDTSPQAFCSSEADCAEGRLCVDGACRTPCPEAPATCQHFDFQLTVCNEETMLCEAPSESVADCFGASDCPSSEWCVDGICR
jgi:hypothetical protein